MMDGIAMAIYWKAEIDGFILTGLRLVKLGVFIGFSRNVRQGVNQKSKRPKNEWLFRQNLSGALITGLIAKGENWFFGIAEDSTQKSGLVSDGKVKQ
jgi:hypothetical protein